MPRFGEVLPVIDEVPSPFTGAEDSSLVTSDTSGVSLDTGEVSIGGGASELAAPSFADSLTPVLDSVVLVFSLDSIEVLLVSAFGSVEVIVVSLGASDACLLPLPGGVSTLATVEVTSDFVPSIDVFGEVDAAGYNK